VNVPAGDAKMGKAIFNDLCGACHAISVFYILFRVIVNQLLLQPLEELSALSVVKEQTSPIVRL
jgi:hypothetical protein